jgi:hypothetical protein
MAHRHMWPRPSTRIDDDRNATGASDFDCTADDVGVEVPWRKPKVKTGSHLSPLFVGHLLGLGYYRDFYDVAWFQNRIFACFSLRTISAIAAYDCHAWAAQFA